MTENHQSVHRSEAPLHAPALNAIPIIDRHNRESFSAKNKGLAAFSDNFRTYDCPPLSSVQAFPGTSTPSCVVPTGENQWSGNLPNEPLVEIRSLNAAIRQLARLKMSPKQQLSYSVPEQIMLTNIPSPSFAPPRINSQLLIEKSNKRPRVCPTPMPPNGANVFDEPSPYYSLIHLHALTFPEQALHDREPREFWTFPPSGYLKLNFGAYKRNESMEGWIGLIVRNERGHVLFAHEENVVVESTIHAELLALNKGLSMCRDCKYEKLLVEADSMIVVEHFGYTNSLPWKLSYIWAEIVANISLFPYWQVQVCHRRANKVANALAMHQTNSPSTFAVAQLPRDIAILVVEDLRAAFLFDN